MNEVNMVSMIIRNIRSRYPITSEQINDTIDEVYYTIVDLLGYQNEAGDIAVSGELRELLTELNTSREGTLGTSASGVLEAFIPVSGTLDDIYTSLYNINYTTLSMTNNSI